MNMSIKERKREIQKIQEEAGQPFSTLPCLLEKPERHKRFHQNLTSEHQKVSQTKPNKP